MKKRLQQEKAQQRKVCCRKAVPRRKLICLKKHIIQTHGCTDHSGTVCCALRAGIGLK